MERLTASSRQVTLKFCLPTGRPPIAAPGAEMDNELAIVIGRAARQARKARGLMQEHVAEELDVSIEFYSRVERGVALPSLKTFVRMTEVLQVDSNALLATEPMRAGAPTPLSGALPDEPRERRRPRTRAPS